MMDGDAYLAALAQMDALAVRLGLERYTDLLRKLAAASDAASHEERK